MINKGLILKISFDKKENILEKIYKQIKLYYLEYKSFILELTEEDIFYLDKNINDLDKINFIFFLKEHNIKLGFYINSKNYIISNDLMSKNKNKKEIIKVGNFINNINLDLSNTSLICHINKHKINKENIIEFFRFLNILDIKIQKYISIIINNVVFNKKIFSYIYKKKKISVVLNINSYNLIKRIFYRYFFSYIHKLKEYNNKIIIFCNPQDYNKIIFDIQRYNIMNVNIFLKSNEKM